MARKATPKIVFFIGAKIRNLTEKKSKKIGVRKTRIRKSYGIGLYM